MKKLLLTLGTIASIVAPVAAVVACGHKDEGINWSTIDESNVITVPETGSGAKVVGAITDTALAGTVVGTPKGAAVTQGATGAHTSNGGTGAGTSMLLG